MTWRVGDSCWWNDDAGEVHEGEFRAAIAATPGGAFVIEWSAEPPRLGRGWRVPLADLHRPEGMDLPTPRVVLGPFDDQADPPTPLPPSPFSPPEEPPRPRRMID